MQNKIKNRLAAYALALIRNGNKILLIKRSDSASFRPGHYSMVGGLLEKNEPFRQALAREINEEIGITAKQEDLHFIHMFHRNGTDHELVAAVFECTNWTGEPFNKEPNKHSEVAWFDLENLPTLMIPAHRNAIKLIMQKQFYSEQP
ncbi:MAG: NUDIX domain-containing protein [Epsilonproteobacteria bacterium]|nr:NUDIX domain-containing protein [Campylobacterota bacterium]